MNSSSALLNSSKAGDIVVDLFGGSGSTLIGCERLGRVARLMEIDPRYVDCIVQRWQEFTGRKASLAGTGATFEHVQYGRRLEAEDAIKENAEELLANRGG